MRIMARATILFRLRVRREIELLFRAGRIRGVAVIAAGAEGLGEPRMFAISSSCAMFCGKICRLWNSPVSAARDACAFCCVTAAQAARKRESVIATMMGRETFDIRRVLRRAILQKPRANGKD